jgi:SAM-dependent methyltransferase
MTDNSSLLRVTKICRLCGSPLADQLAGFPMLPVAGTYSDPAVPAAEPVFPLTLMRCHTCGLAQLKESLSPSFYTQYRFLSGVAAGYRSHLMAIANDLGNDLAAGASVLEIGASDGTLLALLREQGLRVAGFEPAGEPSRLARAKGLAVTQAFFNPETALSCPLASVDAVVIRHVLEHIDDFAQVFQGLEKLVSPDTALVVEVPDLSSTVELSIYSNIYHIHPCYFDVAAMSQLLTRYGWHPMGSRIVDVFGGSLLLWANRTERKEGRRLSFPSVAGKPPRSVQPSQLASFLAAWHDSIAATRAFFEHLRRTGAKVAGYGAAERTTSLLGTAGLDSSHIEVIYDQNPALDGLAMPGSRIPIRNPKRLMEDRPEYLVIFARSFEEEIVRGLADFRAAGGCFISTRTIPPSVMAAPEDNSARLPTLDAT